MRKHYDVEKKLNETAKIYVFCKNIILGMVFIIFVEPKNKLFTLIII